MVVPFGRGAPRLSDPEPIAGQARHARSLVRVEPDHASGPTLLPEDPPHLRPGAGEHGVDHRAADDDGAGQPSAIPQALVASDDSVLAKRSGRQTEASPCLMKSSRSRSHPWAI